MFLYFFPPLHLLLPGQSVEVEEKVGDAREGSAPVDVVLHGREEDVSVVFSAWETSVQQEDSLQQHYLVIETPQPSLSVLERYQVRLTNL